MSEINLNEISAADFLAAVEDGLIDLDGTVKTASDNDDFELSDLSTEDLIQALETLEEQEQDSTKEEQEPSESRLTQCVVST